MADVDPKVMAAVERAVKKEPKISSADLFLKVTKRHESVRDLSLRQFNARYPLQVRRRIAAKEGGRPGGRKKSTGRNASSRTAVRDKRSGASRLLQGEFESRIQDLCDVISGKYEVALKKDSIVEIDAVLSRLERTLKQWRK